LTNSPTIAAGFARTTKQTAYNHRKWDSEFAKQWGDAVETAMDLSHARAFQRALEGDCDPIYYMGKVVGYVRKYDSRLQIEMLRAHRPDQFKTAGVNLNIGVKGDVFLLTEEQRLELQAINRERILSTPFDATEIPSGHSAPPHNQALTSEEGQ
jgi:hypothetical protein